MTGAPEPDLHCPVLGDHGVESLSPEALRLAPAPQVGENTLRRLLARAEEMDAKGNTVRAAVLRTRAAEGANLTLAGARAELTRLSERLRQALELNEEATERWRKALLPLLARSARGVWSQEARLLYDLQKVCVDSERGVYAVDLIEWALTLGRKPIKRPLPGHQEVAIVRHLRRALGRMRYRATASAQVECEKVTRKPVSCSVTGQASAEAARSALLARLEARIVLPMLLDQLHKLQRVTGVLINVHAGIVYVIQSLPITFQAVS